MNKSYIGFEYSWADLQPVRALSVTIVVAQVIGGAAGLLIAHQADWFLQLWFGASLVSFPAFLIGLVIQSRVRPGSLGQNRTMVARIGFLALVFSLIAIFMPQLGFAG